MFWVPYWLRTFWGGKKLYSEGEQIPLMNKETALSNLAAALGVPVQWVDNLIQFESGWNPAARNPYSGARGLIQFMPQTARDLGYKDADDLYNRNKTIVQQLQGPVRDYFSLPGKRGPYPTQQSLYMAVFYPAARDWPAFTAFPDSVKKVNPGIVLVSDYVRKVNRSPAVKTGINVAMIVLIIGGGYLLYSHLKGKGVNLWPQETETPQITVSPDPEENPGEV
jgi:hypothetical protein